MMAVGGAANLPARVVLDASVLFPAALRDTLLRTARRGLYQPLWMDEILEELRRNLIRDLGLSQDQVRRPIEKMRETFREASVQGYANFVETMTNHPKDRHVLAAAVAGAAGTIVTSNLRHFPAAALDPHDVRAVAPDEFLSDLLAQVPDVVLDVIREQAAALKNPPMSVAEVMDAIAQTAPTFHASVALALLRGRRQNL